MNIAHGKDIITIDLPTKENPREVYFRIYGFSAEYIDCLHADSILKSVGLKAIEGPELYNLHPAFDLKDLNIIKAKVIPIDEKADPYKVGLLEMKAEKIDDLTILSEEDVHTLRNNSADYAGKYG